MPNAMPALEQKTTTPVLYVFFGMIATGKSTLAQGWARHKRLHCYNSDLVRKELAGISPTDNLRQAVDTGIYSREFSRKTYQALLEKAEAVLQRGESVILDASYQYIRDRVDIRSLAKKLGCKVYFILCQCSEPEMQRRMDLRALDPAAGRLDDRDRGRRRSTRPSGRRRKHAGTLPLHRIQEAGRRRLHRRNARQ